MPSVGDWLFHELRVIWPQVCQKWQNPHSQESVTGVTLPPPANGINESCRIMQSVGDGFLPEYSSRRATATSEAFWNRSNIIYLSGVRRFKSASRAGDPYAKRF